MKLKRVLRGALSVSLSFLLATQALAAVVEHDIGTGDLNITQENVNADGYKVTGMTQEYTITVEDGVKTEITLEDAGIYGVGESAIDIQGSADVTLKLEGINVAASDTEAAIHVTEGSLTITSDSGGYLWADNDFGFGTESAAIGSNEGEDFTGTITSGGSARVEADSDQDGAGIGSGAGGEMSGTIAIQDNAQVDAYSDMDGAGIGSGYMGGMDGTIAIGGSASVYAESYGGAGAGIGSGYMGNMDGTIAIGGNAQVDTLGGWYDDEDGGPGIGAGNLGTMSGDITIDGSAQVVAWGYGGGAGIGGGTGSDITGSVSILGQAGVEANSSEGTGPAIGPGMYGDNGEDAFYGVGIGATINGETVSNMDALLENFDLETAGGGSASLTIVKQAREYVPEYTLRNEARDIQATVRGEDTPTRLLESAITEEGKALLTGDAAEEDILRACHLEFNEDYDGSILLTFFLKGEDLGRRVEIRWLEDGEVVRRTVPVNEDGEARVTLRQLGDFVVVKK